MVWLGSSNSQPPELRFTQRIPQKLIRALRGIRGSIEFGNRLATTDNTEDTDLPLSVVSSGRT